MGRKSIDLTLQEPLNGFETPTYTDLVIRNVGAFLLREFLHLDLIIWPQKKWQKAEILNVFEYVRV